MAEKERLHLVEPDMAGVVNDRPDTLHVNDRPDILHVK